MNFEMAGKISVIMGIYNCAHTLSEALDCIINQSYTNWELLMCDDGSVDDTVKVAETYVRKYPDKIILLKNRRNRGLNYTLNRCIKRANGNYIARMDGDDLCSLDRFEKEIKLLQRNPGISIVSTAMEFFDQNGIWGRNYVKKKPEPIDFLKCTPFVHAVCMVKKEAYEAVSGYSVKDRFLRVEDYHLWIKMYEKGYRGMNIQEPLYQMRNDQKAMQRRKFKYRINEAYVKAYAVNHLKLPVYGYLYCLKPILAGIIPSGVYRAQYRDKHRGEK